MGSYLGMSFIDVEVHVTRFMVWWMVFPKCLDRWHWLQYIHIFFHIAQAFCNKIFNGITICRSLNLHKCMFICKWDSTICALQKEVSTKTNCEKTHVYTICNYRSAELGTWRTRPSVWSWNCAPYKQSRSFVARAGLFWSVNLQNITSKIIISLEINPKFLPIPFEHSPPSPWCPLPVCHHSSSKWAVIDACKVRFS